MSSAASRDAGHRAGESVDHGVLVALVNGPERLQVPRRRPREQRLVGVGRDGVGAAASGGD